MTETGLRLTYQDVARLAQVHVETVRQWVRDGRLECTRLGHRTVRFRREDVERLLDGHGGQGRGKKKIKRDRRDAGGQSGGNGLGGRTVNESERLLREEMASC